MDLNEQTIIGRVGQDPITKGERTTTPIVTFTVATNSVSKGIKTTIWDNVVAFGKTAETCLEYVKKGERVYITGRVTEYKYRKEGENTDRIRREIIVSKLILLGSEDKSTNNTYRKKNNFTDDEIPF